MINIVDEKKAGKTPAFFEKGSVTVEAALTVPLFLFIVISLAFIIRVVYIHELVQHGISETAKEIAASGYLWHISGFQEIHDGMREDVNSRARTFREHMSEVVDAYDAFNDFYGGIRDVPVSDSDAAVDSTGDRAFETVEEAEDALGEAVNKIKIVFETGEGIWRNPLDEFKNIAAHLLEDDFDEYRTKLCIPIIKLCMEKHLSTYGAMDADKRLRQLGVTDGYQGLDFSESRFFEDEGNDIDIIVVYRIRLPVPIRILPEIYLAQRAVVKAWFGGDGAGRGVSGGDGIWSLTNFERGRKIREIFGGNLPESFPVIAKFEDGTATMIKSMDLMAKTYKDCREVGAKIDEYTGRLLEFRGQEKPWGVKGIIIKEGEIKKRELLLIIPGNTLDPEIRDILEVCKEKADEMGVTIRVQTYGISARAVGCLLSIPFIFL